MIAGSVETQNDVGNTPLKPYDPNAPENQITPAPTVILDPVQTVQPFNGTQASALFSSMNLSPDITGVGQLSLNTAPAASELYTVVKGDTVSDIADGNYAQTAAIVAMNNLKLASDGSPIIQEGQLLAIPDISGVDQTAHDSLEAFGRNLVASNQQGIDAANNPYAGFVDQAMSNWVNTPTTESAYASAIAFNPNTFLSGPYNTQITPNAADEDMIAGPYYKAVNFVASNNPFVAGLNGLSDLANQNGLTDLGTGLHLLASTDEGTIRGLGSFVGGTVGGFYNAVTNPVQTLTGLGSIVGQAVNIYASDQRGDFGPLMQLEDSVAQGATNAYDARVNQFNLTSRIQGSDIAIRDLSSDFTQGGLTVASVFTPAGAAVDGARGVAVVGDIGDVVAAENIGATGAFNPGTNAVGDGLGIFADRQVTVSQQGLDLVSGHLSQFDSFPPNDAMLQRLQTALDTGQSITGADAVFYTHEASEATLMSGGMSYDEAHAAALAKYGVSPYSVYAPEVVQSYPQYFNSNWRAFWGVKP